MKREQQFGGLEERRSAALSEVTSVLSEVTSVLSEVTSSAAALALCQFTGCDWRPGSVLSTNTTAPSKTTERTRHGDAQAAAVQMGPGEKCKLEFEATMAILSKQMYLIINDGCSLSFKRHPPTHP